MKLEYLENTESWLLKSEGLCVGFDSIDYVTEGVFLVYKGVYVGWVEECYRVEFEKLWDERDYD